MKQFQRKIEDFICIHCGAKITGNGYTNHCPKCLWSRHVDINPGDRSEVCFGLMQPVGLELKSDQYILIHKCKICGTTKKCKASADDDITSLIKLSETLAKNTIF